MVAATRWRLKVPLQCALDRPCIIHNSDYKDPSTEQDIALDEDYDPRLMRALPLSGYATIQRRCEASFSKNPPGVPIVTYRAAELEFGVISNATVAADYFMLCWSPEEHNFIVTISQIEIVDLRVPQGTPV